MLSVISQSQKQICDIIISKVQMSLRNTFFVTLLLLLLSSAIMALKVDHHQSNHIKKDHNQNPVTKVENPSNTSSCTKQFCISKFGLQIDPFNPSCGQNSTCWREYYGLPHCTDDDKQCWKIAVGYPKECKDDEYDCWIKSFGYVQCDNAQCLKDYLNYTCKYDDLECWRTKTWTPICKWDDWYCWIKANYMDMFCNKKKGYDCVSYYYSNPCNQTDEKCWRKTLTMPDPDCEKDVACFKNFYYLPECKDDDFACWNKLYWGPDCKKGDMTCLKQYLFVPDCTTSKDEVQCYKKWLRYPDCKKDDWKCWKDYYNQQPFSSLFGLFDFPFHDHKMDKPVGFGKMMEHRRKTMAEDHKTTRQFHMKRAGLLN